MTSAIKKRARSPYVTLWPMVLFWVSKSRKYGYRYATSLRRAASDAIAWRKPRCACNTFSSRICISTFFYYLKDNFIQENISTMPVSTQKDKKPWKLRYLVELVGPADGVPLSTFPHQFFSFHKRLLYHRRHEDGLDQECRPVGRNTPQIE